jgi:hypothetical protein
MFLMAYVGSLNIESWVFLSFYVIVEVGNYLENRIDPIDIIVKGD